MTSPPVSVIIPFADYERHLDAAVRSVLGQTYAPVELILVDDGSTDRSAALAQAYVPPARYVRRENGGAGAARNTGIAHASTEFLAFCDVDDVWLPAKLERQMAPLLQDPTLDVVFTGVTEFWAAGAAWPPRRSPRQNVPGALPSAMLVRRAAFERVGPFAEGLRVGEWAEWYTRMREAGLREAWLPEVLVARGLHERNHSFLQGAARIEYCAILRAHVHRQERRAGGA
jgi:glycosyltransferase involved in cell wall biosynthesis